MSRNFLPKAEMLGEDAAAEIVHTFAEDVVAHLEAMRQAAAAGIATDGLAAAPLDRLSDPGELALVRLIAQWPRQVEAAASAHEPHRIAFYLYDLAAAFHAHWTQGREAPGLRFVVEGEDELSRARLALVQGIGFVIGSGLKVFGVTPVEEMR